VQASAYPAHLCRERRLADGRAVLIRPVRPEDQPELRRFYAALSDETRHLRFQKWVREVGEKTLHSFTHIDYDRHMAFVCVAGEEIVGEARYIAQDGGEGCEFAVVIADAWHKTGIAGLLMEALISAARASGLKAMEGLVLRENQDMLRFVRALGFEAHHEPLDPSISRVTKKL